MQGWLSTRVRLLEDSLLVDETGDSRISPSSCLLLFVLMFNNQPVNSDQVARPPQSVLKHQCEALINNVWTNQLSLTWSSSAVIVTNTMS